MSRARNLLGGHPYKLERSQERKRCRALLRQDSAEDESSAILQDYEDAMWDEIRQLQDDVISGSLTKKRLDSCAQSEPGRRQ